MVRLWRSGDSLSVTVQTTVDDGGEPGAEVFSDLDAAVAAIGTFLERRWRELREG